MIESHHGHDHERQLGRRFVISLIITSTILVVEVVGGLISNSLALLSDAAHVFLDVFALALSYFAIRLAQRVPDERHTYGFHRGKVLAALVNSVMLFVVAAGITREAWQRWNDPQPIQADIMMGVAVVGLAANLVVARVLGQHSEDDLNTRSAFWHVLGDALASVGVLLAGIVIAVTGFYPIDPLLSVLIALLILGGSWRIFRESVHILFEGTPAGIRIEDVAESIGSVEGVTNVHDLHVWTVSPGYNALSTHVVVGDRALADTASIMEAIKERLGKEHRIYHTTIQFECYNCGQCGDAYEGGVCYLPQPFVPAHAEHDHEDED